MDNINFKLKILICFKNVIVCLLIGIILLIPNYYWDFDISMIFIECINLTFNLLIILWVKKKIKDKVIMNILENENEMLRYIKIFKNIKSVLKVIKWTVCISWINLVITYCKYLWYEYFVSIFSIGVVVNVLVLTEIVIFINNLKLFSHQTLH